MWVSDKIRPPSTALAPPERPDPAPRGTTGTRCAVAQRSAAETSSVDRARTTARGMPAAARSALSRR